MELDNEVVQPTGQAQSNFTVVPNAAIMADIKPAAFKVYVALRSYLRPGSHTYPHAATVCAQYNIPERTFASALKELQDAGLLVITKRVYANGFRRANEYYFPDVPERQILPDGDADIAVPDPTLLAHPQPAIFAVPKEEEKLEEEKGSRRKQSLRSIPADFVVTAEMKAWAKAKAPGLDADWETSRFKDYYADHPEKKHRDWAATWRDWMRRQIRFQASAPQQQPVQQGKYNMATPLAPYENEAELSWR